MIGKYLERFPQRDLRLVKRMALIVEARQSQPVVVKGRLFLDHLPQHLFGGLSSFA